MKRKIFYSLSALAVVVGLAGCGGGAVQKTQSPEVAINSNNTIPVPVVKMSDTNVTTDKVVVFDASDSYDHDNDPLEFVWKDENGKVLSTQPKVNRVFTTAGVYTMTLEVTDEKGGVAEKTVRIKVTRHDNTPDANQPPVALAIVSTATIPATPAPVTIDVNSGDLIHFSDNGSYDPDGRIVKYEWRDTDGVLLCNGHNLDKKFCYYPEYDVNNDGTTRYVVTLYVTDDKGAVSSVKITIIVHKQDDNIPPTVEVGHDRTILAGQFTRLTATASDPDGTIKCYIWKKGDVVVAKGENMSVYRTDNLSVGTHTYSVTVIDNDGAETTKYIKVIVVATGASGS